MFRLSIRPDAYPSLWGRLCGATIAALLAACSGDDPTEVEEDDPCAVSAAIAIGQSTNASLAPGDCLNEDGVFSDRWELEVAAETNLVIELSSATFDAYLELLSPGGFVISENDDHGDSYDSRIIRAVAAGSYTIVARSYGPGQSGPYHISVDVAPDCSALGALELGVTVSGSLVDGDCLLEVQGVVDNWTLQSDGAEHLRARLVSPGFAAALVLFDAQGDFIDSETSSNGLVVLEVQPPAGTYTLGAAAQTPAPANTYTLTLDVAPPCTPGSAVVLGETLEGELTGDECIFPDGLPADSFAVEVSESTRLSFHLKSSDFDPLFVVLDGSQEQVLFGSDQSGSGNATAAEDLEPGRYAVYVAAIGAERTGSYQLTVLEVDCGSGTVAVGETVTGELTQGDCPRAGDARYDRWELTVANPDSVWIDLSSTDFDPYLVLQDSGGSQIAADDDDGPALNARIQRRLEAGSYAILASARTAGERGEYELSVGPPPAAGSTATLRTPTNPVSLKADPPRPDSNLLYRRLIDAATARRRIWPLAGRGSKRY